MDSVPGHDFRFYNEWILPVQAPLVLERLVNLGAYPTWWRQVRSVVVVTEQQANVRARSLLPASLNLVLTRELEDLDVGRLRVGIEGDLLGHVEVRVTPVAGGCRLVWEQRVLLTKPGLRRLAPLPPARWVLRANHAVMMQSARRGLSRPA